MKRSFTLVAQAPTTKPIHTSIVATVSATPALTSKAISTSIVRATSAATTTNVVTTYWQNSGKLQ
jgi:hypothetical protein